MDLIRKFPAKPVIILLSGIMMVGLLTILPPSNAFAQTLHNRTLYELVNQTSGLHEISGISVGNGPAHMA